MFASSEASKKIAAAEEMRHAIHRRRIHDQDLLHPKDLDAVLALEKGYAEAISKRDVPAIEALDREATPLTNRVFPMHPLDLLRENIEVLIVAMVLALAVRTYFVQPFKIPTGSMQPTLYGVVVEDYRGELPNQLTRTWDSLVAGRTYGQLVANADGRVTSIASGHWMIWFEYTDVTIGPETYRIWLGPNHVQDSLRITEGRFFSKGQQICSYVSRTGDQLLVNKFLYHFRKPQRGEIFVFSTRLIPALSLKEGTQYYIKRCVGIPGDRISIDRPYLFLDGKILREPYAIDRMYTRQEKDPNSLYDGYFNVGTFGELPTIVNALGKREYWALGDNSGSSRDSRYWGKVPEDAIVGTPLFVYWPFTSRWGRAQ
ncbi:MAG TPA: signal peptidase I [Candidatus Methylacidiphilales bacterium]|nr:signal peptidase I [Candidatus Methylacidiphilales bacterium]